MQENRFDLGAEGRSSDLFVQLTMLLSSCRDFSENILQALHILGEGSGHDRIQIIEIQRNMTYEVRYEWCKGELLPASEFIKNRALFYDAWLEKQLCEKNYMMIRELGEVENTELREFLQGQQCRRMLSLPLFESGSQFAFLTFMQCSQLHDWTNEEIRRLENMAIIIARQLDNYRMMCNMLHRLKSVRRKKEEAEQLHFHLRHLHARLFPEWVRLREELRVSNSLKDVTVLHEVDRHIEKLDRLCRQSTIK